MLVSLFKDVWVPFFFLFSVGELLKSIQFECGKKAKKGLDSHLVLCIFYFKKGKKLEAFECGAINLSLKRESMSKVCFFILGQDACSRKNNAFI